MTANLTSLQCLGCGGVLRSLDARVWQCAYCESRYTQLGEETPVPGLARVVDGSKVSLYRCEESPKAKAAADWFDVMWTSPPAKVQDRVVIPTKVEYCPPPRPPGRPRQPLLR